MTFRNKPPKRGYTGSNPQRKRYHDVKHILEKSKETESQRELIEKVRHHVLDKLPWRVILTHHAKERMLVRGINMEQVRAIVESGSAKRQQTSGEWVFTAAPYHPLPPSQSM